MIRLKLMLRISPSLAKRRSSDSRESNSPELRSVGTSGLFGVGMRFLFNQAF
jgi:hypothetical protein